MKRAIIALTLVLCMTFVFVGCSDKAPSDATPDEAPTQAQTEVEETQAQDNTPTTITFNAFNYNGIEYNFILTEGKDKNSLDVKFNNLSFTVNEGEKIEDVLERNNYYDMRMEEVFDKFLGFMAYKSILSEDGLTVTYEKLSDKLYSIDELMEKQAPAESIVYVARWEKIDDDYYAAYGY